MFGDDDQRKLLYGGEIYSLVKRARAHAAIANVGNGNCLLLLHAGGEQHARHHRNHVAQMRDGANETFLHIAEMYIQIAAAGWAPGFRHVLRKDFAWANSFHQHRAEIAN